MVIKTRRIGPDCEYTDFHCGNNSIECQIKKSYHASLLKEGYGYEILADDIIVGYYMLGITIIHEAALPNVDKDHSSGLHQEVRYGAIELVYLAIDEKYQKHKIGKTVLKSIVSNVRNLSESIPIRYMVLDALKSKVKWYKDNGFFQNEEQVVSDGSPTVKMFMDFADHNKIDKYENELV